MLLSAGIILFFLPDGHPLHGWSKAAWAFSALSGIWFVAPQAVSAARRLRPDMNLLMTVAVIGAGILGDWFEAASTAFLFSLALYLETWSVSRARREIESLMALTPRTAHVLGESGEEEILDVERVLPGSVVLIRPGDVLPLDGEIVRGETEINEAPLTGESVPVFKSPGAEVFAGTVNGDGVVHVRTTKPFTDTFISRIMVMVREAQSRRAPISRWVDRFAEIYTPIMMLFALLTAVTPPLLGMGPFSEWIRRGLVVLVTACPCALAISTPVSILSGLTAAVRRGVLIKGGAFLEAAAKLKAIAFDKTGTLTSGSLRVVEVLTARGRSREELFSLAAALESRTTHPVGRAVLEYVDTHGRTAIEMDGSANVPGLGMRGSHRGEVWYAGSPIYFERITNRPFSPEELGKPRMDRMPQVLVFSAGSLVGGFVLEDSPRAESPKALEALRRLGVRRLVMLTGDQSDTAERVGKELRLDEIRAGLMPEQKLEVLQALRSKHGLTAMVGDGVNDAPALASADIGIAMGAIGTGVALETADIALMRDDLSGIPWLVFQARRTLRIVRENILFSLGVKAAFILLALLGAAELWMAVVADMGTSLLVIANGLRLLRRAEIFPVDAKKSSDG